MKQYRIKYVKQVKKILVKFFIYFNIVATRNNIRPRNGRRRPGTALQLVGQRLQDAGGGGNEPPIKVDDP